MLCTLHKMRVAVVGVGSTRALHSFLNAINAKQVRNNDNSVVFETTVVRSNSTQTVELLVFPAMIVYEMNSEPARTLILFDANSEAAYERADALGKRLTALAGDLEHCVLMGHKDGPHGPKLFTVDDLYGLEHAWDDDPEGIDPLGFMQKLLSEHVVKHEG